MKETKNHYNEKHRILKKEIEEERRIRKDLSCSYIGRINVAKMAILPKVLYRCNGIHIKISLTFFTEFDKTVLKFTWKNKIPRLAKAILR